MKSPFWHRWLRTNCAERPARRAAGAGPRRRTLSLETMEDRSLPSGMPQMLVDVSRNTNPSDPTELVTVGTSVFFSAYDGLGGRELYRTDGSAAGTTLVKDIDAHNLADVNGTLFFASGAGLWKSDGTPAGTVLVRTIYSTNGRSPANLTNVDGTLYFTAASFDVDGHGGRELWKSDGTTAGTVLVKDINPGRFGSYPASLTNVNGVLYFAADDATRGTDLWRSDGTEAGTTLVKDVNPGSARTFGTYVTAVNGTLFYRADDGVHGLELWKSDGTAAGTVMLKDINPGVGDSLPNRLTSVNGTLFFRASGQLWKSDGTVAGTTLVKDSNPGNLTNVNGTLSFFIGSELWKSDGTTAGTVRVAGGLFTRPWENGYDTLPVVNGTLFFRAYDAAADDGELWKSDGTAAGTVRVKDINPGSGDSFPYRFASANGTLFFTADDGTHGRELWTSDGTAAGTALVADVNPVSTAGPGHASAFTTVGSTTYFLTADDRGDGLWKSDGTTAGTTLVKGLPAGSFYLPGTLATLTNVNGTLYFVAGNQVWKSDGTTAGTAPVASVGVSSPLTDVNGTLFFASAELWKSDGTEAGTVMVKDINPGSIHGGYSSYPLYSHPGNLTNVNGTLYFTADDGAHGRELWKSDGTEAGTVLVKDVYPGAGYSHGPLGGLGWYPNSSGPEHLTTVNGTLYFVADDGTHGRELWRTDGTAAGTVLVTDLNPGAGGANPDGLTSWNGLLYFAATDGTRGAELWRTDGTADGTTLVKDVNPGAGGANPANFASWNGLLYFAANDGTHGSELWRTDGTAGGTVLVRDINPGSPSSNPASLTNSVSLYFAADDGTSGVELWASDGTSAGTLRVKDINPGSGGSNPTNLTVSSGTLFFRANDGVHGPEPWTLVESGLGVSGFPAAVTAGAAGTLTVTAVNPDGTTNTDYRGTVRFASTDPQAVLPANYTFTAGDRGVHTFTVTLKTAGTQSVSARDTIASGPSGTQAGITVTPAAASTLAVAGYPSPRPVGSAAAFNVTAMDPFGNRVPSYTGTAHLTSTDPLATVSAAEVYNPAADFSATDNPNGAWQYGWSQTLGSEFLRDAARRNVSGIDLWMGEQASDGNPSVSHNGTAHSITPGSMTWQPGQLGFHPGPNGEYAVVRWTAPRAGSVSLGAAFSGLDFVGPTTTDVHVLHNGSAVFAGEVLAFGAGPSVAATRTVLAGDTIDFAVGYGSNGTFDCDSTGLDVAIAYDSQAITDYTFTPADAGRRTFNATFWTGGIQSLTATDTATAGITGIQENIEVTTATRFLVSGFPSPVTAGAAEAFSIAAMDNYGNVVPGYRGTVRFSSSDAAALLPGDYAFTEHDRGAHSFTAALRTVGTQSLTATDLAGSTITGTQTGIQVEAPRISIGDVARVEGNAGMTSFVFTVSLSAAATTPVTVAFATANGTAQGGQDYVTDSRTLTFATGETTTTVTVQVIGDRLAEPNETFLVNLSAATNATIVDGQGIGTIVDDEPRISIGDVAKAEGKRNKTTLFTFTVSLSRAYDQPVTVSYRTVDGTATTGDGDYIAKTGTLTFNPGETTKTISIEIKGDSKREADETFTVNLSGATNAEILDGTGLGTILNDD